METKNKKELPTLDAVFEFIKTKELSTKDAEYILEKILDLKPVTEKEN